MIPSVVAVIRRHRLKDAGDKAEGRHALEYARYGDGIGCVGVDYPSDLAAFSLQPHRTEMFKLSTDPQFVEKVRDIVGLYLDPPEKALVICVDEKSQIQTVQ